jgi:predicted DNA-binding transcriptional regulator AlpA
VTDSPNPSKKYLRVNPLRARYGGVSDMWITRKMRDDDFPQPHYLGGGRDRYWRIDELDQWDREHQTRERPKSNAPPPPSRAKAASS